MHLFYAPNLNGEYHTLEEQESKHCIKVMRMKTGDTISLTDGRGNMFLAELINDNARSCEVRIMEVQKEYERRNYQIHLAVAPTKNINRFEWFLEKATEIGVDEITPLICKRSERKIVKIDRLNKVITAALKQSIKAYHPVLNEAISFNDFIRNSSDGQKFIAYVEEGEHPPLKTLYKAPNTATILIGPEGDFSPEEVMMAIDQGYKTVNLGDSRLRTETAGFVACHTIALLNRE